MCINVPNKLNHSFASQRKARLLATGTTMSKRSSLLVLSILFTLFTPVPAPFPKGDARAIFNPLIEPWWCIVPKFVR